MTVSRLLALVSLSPLLVAANSDAAGAQAAETLVIEPDARHLAMGSAGVGLADDVNAVFWNPAGLAFQQSLETAFAAMTLRQRIRYFRAAGRYTALNGTAVGVALTRTAWRSPGCHWRSFAASCSRPATDVAASLSFAHRQSRQFASGLTIKVLHLQRYADVQVFPASRPNWRFALDLGVLYKTEVRMAFGKPVFASFGANIANLGRDVQYGFPEEEHVLPKLLRLGSTIQARLDSIRSARFIGDLTIPLADKSSTGLIHAENQFNVTAAVGGEYSVDQYLTLRGGLSIGRYQFEGGVHPTSGIGISLATLRIDVSWIPALRAVHVDTRELRLSFRIGREDTTVPYTRPIRGL